jgi:GT2 family glycosyltransferase
MDSSRDRAPIALFVYNRVDPTRQTLDALARNNGALDSDLIIFSDGAKGETDAAQVADVRALTVDIKGFRSVKVVHAASNRGLAPSIISGVTEIVEEWGRVIVLEDDILTSPVFLDFMNDALDMYHSEERVASISGYIFPLDIGLPEKYNR